MVDVSLRHEIAERGGCLAVINTLSSRGRLAVIPFWAAIDAIEAVVGDRMRPRQIEAFVQLGQAPLRAGVSKPDLSLNLVCNALRLLPTTQERNVIMEAFRDDKRPILNSRDRSLIECVHKLPASNEDAMLRLCLDLAHWQNLSVADLAFEAIDSSLEVFDASSLLPPSTRKSLASVLRERAGSPSTHKDDHIFGASPHHKRAFRSNPVLFSAEEGATLSDSLAPQGGSTLEPDPGLRDAAFYACLRELRRAIGSDRLSMLRLALLRFADNDQHISMLSWLKAIREISSGQHTLSEKQLRHFFTALAVVDTISGKQFLSSAQVAVDAIQHDLPKHGQQPSPDTRSLLVELSSGERIVLNGVQCQRDASTLTTDAQRAFPSAIVVSARVPSSHDEMSTWPRPAPLVAGRAQPNHTHRSRRSLSAHLVSRVSIGGDSLPASYSAQQNDVKSFQCNRDATAIHAAPRAGRPSQTRSLSQYVAHWSIDDGGV